MIKVVIAYHSGYGHTKKLAEAVHAGAAGVIGTSPKLLGVDAIDEAGWRDLAAADAIVFGAPTYMGGASAPFKVFADASVKPWFTQAWKDKVAGGFTCSLGMSGDKYATLMSFVTLAMQHGMIWVGTGTPGAQHAGAPEEINRLGAWIGVMAQADNAPPEQTPPSGDIASARAYGRRIAEITKALRK